MATGLSFSQQVQRFGENEPRVDVFVNGDEDDYYTTTGGIEVPSLRNILDKLDLPAPGVADYQSLRNYEGISDKVEIQDLNSFGIFYKDSTDTTSVDNAGTVIVSSNGIRWKRLFSGPLNVKWFGAKADFTTDDTLAIQKTIDFAFNNDTIKSVYIPSGRYLVSGQLIIRFGVTVYGDEVARRAQPGNWINLGAAGVTRSGADFFTDQGKNSTNITDGFIIHRPNSQIKNINIWYISQTKIDDPATLVPYAPTFVIGTSEDGNSDNVIIENISALNSYEILRAGDGVNSVGRFIIRDLFANPFGPKAFTVRSLNGDVPMFQNIFLENLFTITPEYTPNLYNYQRNNCTIFDFGSCQGINLTDSIALSGKIGITFDSGSWGQVVNCLFDYCKTPLVATGSDNMQFTNCTFKKNFGSGEVARVYGQINHLGFVNCNFGDTYSGQKTGVWAYHTSGTIKFSSCTFKCSFPAVLNSGNGAVEISSCGVGYDKVTGGNISIEGGPGLVAGASLNIANINPTFPAAGGWTYSSPGNVSAITNGIRIQGPGNNTLTLRPGPEQNKIFFTEQILCLKFNMKVVNQAGSPKLELLITNDSNVPVVDAFQISQDEATADSGLPENVVIPLKIILPYGGPTGDSSNIVFSLPNQSSNTVYDITNMDISRVVMPRGYSGLEWFHSKTLLPLGRFNPVTGNRIFRFVSAPPAGTWDVRDEWEQLNPAVGVSQGGVCVTAGSPGTWISRGNFS